MSFETSTPNIFPNKNMLSCEEDDEEWSDDENWLKEFEEEDSFFVAEYEDIKHEDTKELVDLNFIPLEVFEAMSRDELKEYIFYNGIDIDPSLTHKRSVLIHCAFTHQPTSIEAELAYFQSQRADELDFTSKAIAQIDEKEKSRALWERRISAMPAGVPRLVIENIVKYVILMNHPKTVNSVRRVSRSFKATIEQDKFVKAFHFQNLQRKYTKILDEFNIYFGYQVYMPFFHGMGYIPDPGKIYLYKTWLEKLDPNIRKQFSSSIRIHVYQGLTRFKANTERQLKFYMLEVDRQIKNL